MSSEKLQNSKSCGCCRAPAPPTPEEIWNRPGLPTVGYRVGSYASFRQAMIQAIARKAELRGWTARSSDDYGIALLEMWAHLADILTFYQQRIANEAFLRTALLRESVVRLAALLDYKPAPGVAATAGLAFLLEEGKQARIPLGLRVQSVPGQDEKPQKFETIEEVLADSRLNRIRVFPVATAADPFEQGSEKGMLHPSHAEAIANSVSPGDKLVFFNDEVVEQKEITDVHTQEERQTFLSWTPAMQQDLENACSFKFVRQLKLFGHNAPNQYLAYLSDPNQPDRIIVELRFHSKNDDCPNDYHITLAAGQPLSLDSRYDDLKPGSTLLIQDPGVSFVGVVTIETVSQAQEEFAPFVDTVTTITVVAGEETDLPNAPLDRRRVIVYELAPPEIEFWDQEFGEWTPRITAKVWAQADGLCADDIPKHRAVILTDAKGTMEAATVVDAVPCDGEPYLEITFKSAFQSDFDTKSLELFGNVVKATHGETVASEVLGSGDASVAFQSFPLKKSPTTFVSDPRARHGAANTLEVRVDRVLWNEKNTLHGHTGTERIYTTSVDDEGVMTVQFGDGKTGARLPTGRDNVVATYRQGLGRGGRVEAGSLTTLLDRPLGLKSVTNPAGASGGVEPESLENARANAPNTVRTFGRIVSLQDFEDAAREFEGVAKARASCAWNGVSQVVRLTAAGEDRAEVEDELKTKLKEYLDARRDPNRDLCLESYDSVFVEVTAGLRVDEPAYLDVDVQRAARAALEDFFSFANLDLGQSIYLSDLYRVLQRVEGVVAVRITRLQAKDTSQNSDPPPNPLETGVLPIGPTELAVLEPADAELTAGGVP